MSFAGKKALSCALFVGLAAVGCAATRSTGGTAAEQATTTDNGTQGTRTFPTKWADGTDCSDQTPQVDTWSYDPSTFILRQSLCTSFEGPFVYLILGQKKALVLDTGTGDADMATPVMKVVQQWQTQIGADAIELVVAHTHSHGDHVGGDSQFAGAPNTTVVHLRPSDVATFFGLGEWPTGSAEFDLGDRVLDVFPIPGHEASHIAVFDRREKILFTGDTLYPGRLYVADWAAYQASTQRLADFASSHTVQWVLGAHVEMPKVGADYPFGASRHPNEHAMSQDPSEVGNLNDAVIALGTHPRRDVHTNFIIYPLF